MSVPSENVDVFRHRPDHEVVALLPGQQEVEAAVEDLRAGGVDVANVRLLHGEEGARILDRRGTEHGWRSRVVRLLQNLGYDENILAVYEEGLRKGEAVLCVPCSPDRRHDVGRLLIARGGHAVVGFTGTSAETFSGP
ncbi:MAG TPA: hypothetical protein VK053_18860 [Jiangellaceae bacterium]|nr:hypothetical protein [Jiangellaceae bacterium]